MFSDYLLVNCKRLKKVSRPLQCYLQVTQWHRSPGAQRRRLVAATQCVAHRQSGRHVFYAPDAERKHHVNILNRYDPGYTLAKKRCCYWYCTCGLCLEVVSNALHKLYVDGRRLSICLYVLRY